MGDKGGVRRILKTERISIVLGAIAAVAACAEVEVGAHAVKSSTALSESGSEERLAPVQVATDAEGYALWSGFRTVNGAWVAHPRLPAPSRAYVRNPINGRVIEAELLRRDPTTPGPMILLSAEAARALEIGPHRLTKVQIEVIKDSLPDTALAQAPTAEVPAPAPAGDVTADALAPLAESPETLPEAAPLETPALAADAPAQPEQPSATTPQVLAQIPAADEAPAPAAQPAPAEIGTAPEPQVLAQIPAEPAPVASAPLRTAEAPAAPQAPDGVFRGDAPYQFGGASGGGTLAATAPAAASAPQAPTPAPSAPTPAAAPRSAEPPAKPAPAAAEGAAPASDEQRFVQVVSFTAESSAAELATRLNALGHPSLTDSGLAGETRWHRVLIGPLNGDAEVESALGAARELGYRDAFVTLRPAEQPATPRAAAAAPAPAAPAPASSAPAAKAGETYIQVGSFRQAENAEAAARRLKEQGLPSFTNSGSGGESSWHRVLIGPLKDPEAADAALREARAMGHTDAYITRF